MILIIWRETTWQLFCRLMMGKHGALRFFWMNANSFLIQMRCKTPDDQIYIIYDRERNVEKELLLARITEEDILRGKLVSDGSFFKKDYQ